MNAPILETVIYELEQAARRLRELELDDAGLVEVILRGERARAEAVAYDPVTAAGYDAYRHRVRALREIYCPRGWEAVTDNNLEILQLAHSHRRIITRGGDDGVGIRDAHPQPKRERIGSVTAAVIGQNASLFLNPNWMNVAANQNEAHETWMLLVCRAGDLVRAELSLPTAVEDDRVMGWFERIILGSIDFSGSPNYMGGDSSGGTSPVVVEVPVVARR